MTAPNIRLRDPVIYRSATPSTTTRGRVVHLPMYDFAALPDDYIEASTHSICTSNSVHRPLYDWILTSLDLPGRCAQYEFARLNVATPS